MSGQLMERYLHQRGLDHALACRNGWYASQAAGDAGLRIVIPATASDPRNRFWQARSIDGTEPRYQSPHSARGDALTVVWPREQARGSVIIEGPMDALAAAELGYVGVALLGGNPSTEVLNFARNLVQPYTPRLLIGDNDSPQFMAKLAAWFVPCRFLLPTPWKDLAECPRLQRRQLLES